MYVPKKRANVLVNKKQSQRVTDLLAESDKAIKEGNSQRAYDLSVQATQIAPQSIEAWLLRATLARSLEERVVCVNQLNELAPGYQDRYNVAFFAIKELVDKKPFLAYLEETDELYRVISENQVLSIPKKRAPVNPYPPEQPQTGALKSAQWLLTISILGLLLAGVGTVIFAPLAALAAIQAQKSVQSPAERISSTVLLVIALILFAVGFLFSILFILHWMG